MNWHPSFATIVLAALASSAVAEPPVVREWSERMAETAKLLEGKKYEKARSRADRLAREMTRALGPGAPAGRILSAAVLQRAEAEAGLGMDSDASWSWHAAVALDPALEETGLGRYGELARAVQATRPTCQVPELSESDAAVVARPDRRWIRPLQYPYGAWSTGAHGKLVILAVIRADGSVACPRLRDSPSAPTLVYSVLEAMRGWRFAPANLYGTPIAFPLEQVVTFEPH